MSVAPSVSADTGSGFPIERDSAASGTLPVLPLMMFVAAMVLFACSSVRHYVLRSGAFDLGFFDQAVWLISQGQTPISSLRDFHVLADHASLILYPLSLLYLIWADPHMLLAAQALALAAGAWPVHRLALGADLSERQALAMAAAYLMYPFVLTANLFDFHPETLAVPAILMAVLAAREDQRFRFCIWVAIVLACKEVLALTVAMMGVWLLLAERRRFYGIVALAAGAVWFIIALKFIVPYFGEGRQPSGMNYYAYLGTSLGGIITTIFTQPHRVLGKVFSAEGLTYLAILGGPAIWGLHYRKLAPLMVCLPAVALNVLSTNEMLRSPFHQYSVPMVPFFFLAMILAVAAGVAWLKQPRFIVGWAVMLLAVGFAVRLARIETGRSSEWDTLQHTRAAIKQVPVTGSLMTTFEVFPHVSRRPLVHFVGGHDVSDHLPLHEYDAVLLNVDQQSMNDYTSWVNGAIQALRISPEFRLAYEQPDVVLFVKVNSSDKVPADPARNQTARSDVRRANSN